ncbi:heptaprenyl diphosphate synthase component ii [hydrocarbon metagenome]|uniref:Heptaprenyl diphosphate synthase component ii n=1 Tax=hydrocarbon metagenome TaxID=938273 RepID=A0A0W8E2J1_9ZZZZ
MDSFPAAVIKNRMVEVLQTNLSDINIIIDYLLQSSGKMLRPRLVYLSALLTPHEIHKVIDISVAVELIHMASLLHDDVIDRADCRRGRESVNHRWGNQASVLTGDYLFAAAFNLINRHDLDQVMDSITSTIQIMCTGEIKQMSMNGDLGITEEDYYDKTYRKTACLFASSCRVGALVAQAPPEQVKILERFGLNLGYAYQLIDDVLDFTADPEELGKPAGNDLTQGNITLPVILALKDHEKGIKLRNLLEDGKSTLDKMPLVVNILWECGALEKSIMQSGRFLQQALDHLHQLPANPARNALKDTVLYLMDSYYQRLMDSKQGGEGWLQSGNA